MPTYEYLCDDCGPFTDLRPMAESDLPHDCPHCGDAAPRAYLTAPYMSGLSTERRMPSPPTSAARMRRRPCRR